MVDIEKLKLQIVENLRFLDINSIILFGSYANGKPHEDSDIDLYIVTNDDFIPKNFKEKMQLKLKVASVLKEFQKIIPIDIITHTKKMHDEFVKTNSSFSREILNNGLKLYG